ncbi:MAG: HD domain-containing protein [Helicobacteraceae bacterium]|nr:HD domain-containing protein [Helicobacteraceae bacterium]
MNITLEIENLIEKNSSDFEISKVFKAYIKEYKSSLPTLFEKNQGKDFLVKHTKSMDNIIKLMYNTVLRTMFHTYLPMKSSIPIAIIALGSFGREQLCVHSDIDLMIAYEDVDGFNTKEIIEKFVYLAWDSGLKLGHRVHNINDILKASREDITIKTAMMESRFVIGSTFTWNATERALYKVKKDNTKEYILAKIEEANIRRTKYPTSMQPNLKEGCGSLRDTQLLYWVAIVTYNVTQLKELIGVVFSEDEYKEYRVALELLFRVRTALHIITNKQQDTLILEYMPQVASLLGFQDAGNLITKVLSASWRLNNFATIFIKKMVRKYLNNSYSFSDIKKGQIKKGFYLIEGRLYSTYTNSNNKINELLELLIDLDDQVWEFDPSFLYQFSYSKIKHPLSDRTYSLLKQLLSRNTTYCFLKLFYDAGIIHHLFGAFKKVLNLPQFDGYHKYPVVLHSLKSIEALENIENKYINELHKSLSNDEKLVLKVSTLLHDSGKGRKLEHGEVGAKLITAFGKNLKLKDSEIESAATLVKHHILMSNIAYREDIYNEKVLYKFMSAIKTEQNLKLLYILTYADIVGVDKELFTTFTGDLLQKLYHNALTISNQTERISDASKRLKIEKRIEHLEEFKALPKTLSKKVLKVESNLFFFKHTPLEIIEIATRAKELKDYNFNIDTDGSFSIEILRKIPLNLGFLLGRLSYLNIVSMDVFTLFDNVKYFRLKFFNSPNEDEIFEIERIVEDSFDMSQEINLKKPLIKKEEIDLDLAHSLAYAQVTIHTKNQLGLLAYVVTQLDKEQINIATAKIHSTKHKVRDHFLIEKNNNTKESLNKVINDLTQS